MIKSPRFVVQNSDNIHTTETYAKLEKFPITVILDNLRSAYNVGSIFRTSDCARIEEVITAGYTAHPPHIKLEKTALGTEKFLKTQHFEKTIDAVKYVKNMGIMVVALETADKAYKLTEFNFPKPICIVVGNEANGISEDVLEEVDEAVRIPMFGYKNSLNVCNAYSIALFEILRQWNIS